MGYRFDLGTLSLEPFLALDHTWITLDATTERGGVAALAVAEQDYKVAGATPGIAGKLALGKLRLDAATAVRFELGDRTPMALTALAAAPGQSGQIAAARLNSTAFQGRLGAVMAVTQRMELRFDYSGEFSANDTEHSAMAGVRITF